MPARIIVTTSGKGGVGKTTSTANIAAALAKFGKKVVDSDITLGYVDPKDDPLHKNEFDISASGNGPIDACIKAVQQAGFNAVFENYEQKALNMGSDAVGMTIMYFKAKDGTTIISRGCDENTFMANIKAIFNGLNIIENEN